MNLISFAFDKNIGTLVDIESASSGLDCNCICPCCKQPLIAKKGNINRWHFAHKSGVDYEDICIYTPERAAKAMLLQLLPSILVIRTPSYNHHATGTVITDSTLVDITKVEFDDSVIQGNHAKIHVGKHAFLIYIALSSVDKPEHIPDTFSLLVFDMSLFIERLNKTNKTDATTLLKQMVTAHHPAKYWAFHVKEKTVELYPQRPIDKNKLRTIDVSFQKIQIQKTNHLISSPKNYLCIPCNHYYEGREPGLNQCPKCKNHLYRKLISN